MKKVLELILTVHSNIHFLHTLNTWIERRLKYFQSTYHPDRAARNRRPTHLWPTIHASFHRYFPWGWYAWRRRRVRPPPRDTWTPPCGRRTFPKRPSCSTYNWNPCTCRTCCRRAFRCCIPCWGRPVCNSSWNIPRLPWCCCIRTDESNHYWSSRPWGTPNRLRCLCRRDTCIYLKTDCEEFKI